MTTETKAERTRLRIIEEAQKLFAREGNSDVSFVKIAQQAQITSQAIYRYFPNKQELYKAAIADDLDRFLFSVLEAVSHFPAPLLSGLLWDEFQAKMRQHPLIQITAATRDPVALECLREDKNLALLKEALKFEILKSKDMRFIRQDVNAEQLAESAAIMATDVALPLVFEGKYGSPAWFAVQHVILAAAFSPLPKFEDPEVAKDFSEKIKALGTNDVLKNYFFP